jgi:integrase
MTSLTERTAKGAKPGEQRYTLWDGKVAGLGLRVEPSGLKTFIVRYRSNGGGRGAPERLIVIGRYGAATMTVEQARQEAGRVLAIVKLGGDPGAERHQKRGMPTFAEVAETFLIEAAKIAVARPQEARLRSNTIRNYRSLLYRHVRPAFGSLKIDAVTTADVQRLHRRIGAKRPINANRALEFIASVYKEAGRLGTLSVGINPAKGVEAFRENRREHFLSVEEIARLGAAIREAETVGLPWSLNPAKKTKHVPKTGQRTSIDQFAAAALRLLVFTGARLREILHAKWDAVDLERGILTVFGKTGRRHIVLPAPAVAILAKLPRVGRYVIAGESAGAKNERPRSDLNRPWRAVRARAGLEGTRIHDLRHSHASLAVAGGASLPIVGALLGHSSPNMTARYAHLGDHPVRAASEKVAATAAAALDGHAEAEVKSLPARKKRR